MDEGEDEVEFMAYMVTFNHLKIIRLCLVK